MEEERNEAVVFMIDNSDTSINGDFEPNRLEAQKLSVLRLANFYLRENSLSVVAVGCIGSEYFGIQSSLASSTRNFNAAFERIEAGGAAQIVRGVKCATLTLGMRRCEFNGRRIVLFIGSKHDLTMDSAKELAEFVNKEGISVDIVAFGQEVNNLYVLEAFTRMTMCESYFIRVRSNEFILSDSVLASAIGPGCQMVDVSDDLSDDDELRAALKASIEEMLEEEEEEEIYDEDNNV